MKAINITKFSNQSEHFYATFWSVNSMLDMDDVESGTFALDDRVFSNLENENIAFGHIKDSDEKNLMKAAKKKLIEYCGVSGKIIAVFYDGKYSRSRTEYISSLKIEE